MKVRNSFKRPLSLLCCLAMLMAWLPVLPVAAADPVMSENFDSLPVGGFSSNFSKSNLANDGTVSETVQSFGGSKVLQLDVQNTSASTQEVRARIKTTGKWSGSHTVVWDMYNQSDKWTTFETYVRTGGYVRPRINSDGQMCFYVHEAAKVAGVMQGMTSGITLSTKKWYSMRVQVTDELVTFSATDRDTGKELGEISLKQSTSTYGDLLAPYEFWFSYASPSKLTDTAKYSMLIDNFAIYDGAGAMPSAPSTPSTPSTPSVEMGSSQQGIKEGKERWIIQQDDFESYPLGEDTFYGTNTNDYSYIVSYHGTKSDDANASYSLYGVVNDTTGKALKLTSVNATRNWFVTKSGVSGSYSVQVDIKFEKPTGSTTPGFILNPFQGYTFPDGKTMLTYFHPDLIRMADNATTGSNIYHYVKNESGANLQIGYDTWYTVKITVAEGSYCVKAWPQGGAEPTSGAGVVTITTPAINEAVMANANNVRIYNMNRSKPGESYTTYVDNLKIYKTFDSMTAPATLFGVPGEKLSITPGIAGQNLSAEKPALTWAYKLDNPNLGTANNKGELILGPGEGQTKMTITLSDRNGNPAGASTTSTLVVGTSNGITVSPKELKVGENDIGKSVKLTYTVGDEAKGKYPGHTVSLTSSDESVAKVAADGTVTYTGFGTATIAIKLMNGGKDTAYFATVPVQVGEQPLRILSIGNSHSRDSFYYLSYLAAAAGKRVEAAFLHKDSGSIRDHAHNLVTETADYSYYKADPLTGVVKNIGKTTIQTGLADGDWDIIMLHQGDTKAGAPGTYNSDIKYIADYVKAEQPKAKLYWMLGWAYEDDFDEKYPNYTHAKSFKTYYDGSQAKMYNAFIECFDQFIFGEDAKYGDLFDGWFPTGPAIQNLRKTYGDTLTRDGFYLSLTNGRLTAAMAILKTLYPDLDLKEITLDEVSKFLVTDHMENGNLVETDPDYANTEANLQLIRDAVNAATANLNKLPSKLPVGKDVRVEDRGTPNDLTVAQGIAPIKYFFPDVKTMSDGTIFVSAYKNIFHKPSGDAGANNNNMDEGYGTLVGWYSKDNGKTWSEEFTLVDEDKLLGWAKVAESLGDKTSWSGVDTIRNRYELLEKNSGADYFVIADPRDPNLAVVNVDGKELLVMTFWNTYYRENASSRVNKLYMMWAEYDAKAGKLGEWSQPMHITRPDNGACIKRGDIAVFPNGRILIPYYTGDKYGGIGMVWDTAKDTFVYLTDASGKRIDQDMHGVFTTKESSDIDEISFVAPPNSTGMVFAFVRESGEVAKSMDYGMTWEYFGNQDLTIHQPGFQVIDNDRVYVTWARAWTRPRFIYGKVMYVNGSWDDTGYELVYASPNTASHDMGDPSSTLMANGQMLVVCYDTEFRSIVGTRVTVDSAANTPVELNDAAGKATLYEETFQDRKLNGDTITAKGTFEGSYTVESQFALSAGGSIKIAGVTVTADKVSTGNKGSNITLAADTTTNFKTSVVGTALYVKVWQGDKEPAVWTLSTSTTPGPVSATGTNATIKVLRVTHRVAITMPKTMEVTSVTTPTALDVAVNPLQSDMTWVSSNPAVASVKDGVVTFHSVGTAEISLIAGGVKATCLLTVTAPPAEMSGKGEKVKILVDNFENYADGNLWAQMKQRGYNTSTTGEEGNASTLSIGTEGGNKFMVMGGKSSWVRVNTPMTGNYTAQFDFKFTGNGTLYATLNQGSGDTNDTRAFVHIVRASGKASGTRFQYDDANGEPANFPMDPTMHGGLEGVSKFSVSKWYTIKLTRAGEGLYMKLWEQGKAEPEQWSQFLSMPSFNPLNAANQRTYFRLQWATEGKMYIDNLSVTQQQGKGADFMLDVPSGAWYYKAVDYAIKNGIMSGYNTISFGPNDTLSRAMVVQVLYNKEGQPGLDGAKHNFPDVPADQWFNNSVTWGSKKDVVSGFGDGKFRPNDAVTIEQVAVILHNYTGKPASAVEPAGVGKYDDWAKQALGWAVEKGILKDVPLQNATDNATRAQTAQMLMNYIEAFK